MHQVLFQEDGDIEFMSVPTIIDIQQEISVAVGDVGFKFCHKFCHNIYAGEVVGIKLNDKRKCRFNDGEIKDYSLQQLQNCTRNCMP